MDNRHYLFFDIDGTLAQNDNPPSKAVIDALRQAGRNKHMLFICTARTKCDIYSSILDIGFDGIISGAGSRIELGSNVLFNAVLETALLTGIVRQMLEQNITGILEGVNKIYTVPGERKIPWELTEITAPNQISSDMQIQKFTLHPALYQNYGIISEPLSKRFDIIPNESGTFVEFISKKHTKETALRHVMSYLGADIKKSVAFGDGINDLGMLRASGTGIAMGNAHTLAVESADAVTDTIDHDGVASALLKLHLI
ncbi:hypothetical protein LY28_03066 [Ruminiclostridium sufflavum DSM 19573]|uniref:Cof subfamily protein (Haloacid dehalogenase superfamily)/HAD superfamily hydrolase (TIGR01484 family) n=1 Tax=Ruminiclostridium sufflavum DSM 19573 TaxID=1121337 RepID=A0A318XU96_9FIRM|nr:HAD-IIB family hydrolase [Ruminiclostridium sufflavum]PYG85912.1 hypothetical protein LY28_03066 [Ruminiclostridium sufflavum DSM 19573]